MFFFCSVYEEELVQFEIVLFAAYNLVYGPDESPSYRVQEADDSEMGTLELSLRYPTGVHIGVEPETPYHDRLVEDEQDEDR